MPEEGPSRAVDDLVIGSVAPTRVGDACQPRDCRCGKFESFGYGMRAAERAHDRPVGRRRSDGRRVSAADGGDRHHVAIPPEVAKPSSSDGCSRRRFYAPNPGAAELEPYPCRATRRGSRSSCCGRNTEIEIRGLWPSRFCSRISAAAAVSVRRCGKPTPARSYSSTAGDMPVFTGQPRTSAHIFGRAGGLELHVCRSPLERGVADWTINALTFLGRAQVLVCDNLRSGVPPPRCRARDQSQLPGDGGPLRPAVLLVVSTPARQGRPRC